MTTKWPHYSLEELEKQGLIELGRGNVISRKDILVNPGEYPIYSSAKDNEGKFGEYGSFMFDEEMITWSIDGGGKLFYRPKHKFSVTNVGGTLRVKNKELIDTRFLFFALSDLHSRHRFDWVAKAHPSVVRKVYSEIPIPPLDEQKRIVAKLDDALNDLDQVASCSKATLKELDALYDQELIKQFESLTDVVTNKAVSEVTHRITNGYVGPIKDVYVEEGIPYLLARHIRDNKLEFDGRTFINAEFNAKNSKSILKVDDVLLVQSGHIGHSAVVGKSHEGHNCHALIVLTPVEQVLRGSYLSLFFTYCLAAGNFADLRSGSTVPHLTCKEIRKMQIPLPSINQQAEFVHHLTEFNEVRDNLVANTMHKLREFERLRTSILSAAFAGDF